MRNEIKQTTKEGQWMLYYLLPRVALAVFVLSLCGYLTALALRPAEVVNEVTEPEDIIQNYEWFEESYRDTQALDQQIADKKVELDGFVQGLPEDRNEWSMVNQTEYNRLNSVLSGLRSQRNNVVEEYNARSSMLTRNLWKSDDLPYRLEVVDDKTVEDFE